ncbi:hypothetical protein NFI96_034108 [Prochilodus magdalenae]|nr:hypothetical protein NFI96_034108 [Prochilodus magdalenae]
MQLIRKSSLLYSPLSQVKGSLGISVCRAIAAGAAIIALSVDLVLDTYWNCYSDDTGGCEFYPDFVVKMDGENGLGLAAHGRDIFQKGKSRGMQQGERDSTLHLTVYNRFPGFTMVLLLLHHFIAATVSGFEIFAGVITFVLGIAMTVTWPTFSIYSEITYWGSIIYIIAGSLTVAGGTNLNSCLIKGSLGMNVVSTVVSGTEIILMATDIMVLSHYIMTGIELALSILLFIISTYISAFGCKATCCIGPEVPVVTVTLDNAACSSMASPVHVYTGQQVNTSPLRMASGAPQGNNPRNDIMVVTQFLSSTPDGQNAVGPGPGVAAVGVPSVTVHNVGVPNAGVHNVGVHNVGGHNIGVPTIGVPYVAHVNNINTVPAPNPLLKFLKSKPTALGAIQIMIGVFTFLMAIVVSFNRIPFSTYSGIGYWGSVFYIISGSLTVAAEKHLTSCLVKGSLGMNVCSAVVAGTAVILFSMDFAVGIGYNPCYDYYYNCDFYPEFMDRTYGISAVLLILALLQFIITIFSSAFGCKATCCNEPVVSVVTVAPNHPVCCSMVNPFQNHGGQQDVVYIQQNPAVNVTNQPSGNPPAYSQSSAKP